MKIETMWEASDTERPDASNNFLIGLLFLKAAYSKSDEDAIFESLEYLLIEAQYELSDAERTYEYHVQ